MQNAETVERGRECAELEAQRPDHWLPGGKQAGLIQAQGFQRPLQNRPDDIIVRKEQSAATMCFLSLMSPGFDGFAARKTRG